MEQGGAQSGTVQRGAIASGGRSVITRVGRVGRGVGTQGVYKSIHNALQIIIKLCMKSKKMNFSMEHVKIHI